MNGHHSAVTPSSDEDEDEDNPMNALHQDPYNTGGAGDALLDTLMHRQEVDPHMEVAAQAEDHVHQSHRPYASSSGRATSHYGYQGHQHTHQAVSYPQRKKMKHGTHNIWEATQHMAYPHGSSSYAGVRGSAIGGVGSGIGSNWGASINLGAIGNNNIMHQRHSHQHINQMMHDQRKEQVLNKPPRLQRGCPKPLYFFHRDEKRAFIIISTSVYHNGYKTRFGGYVGIDNRKEIVRNGGNEGCIYRYDIWNDSWDKYRKYRDNSFRPYNHGMAIRRNSDMAELWMFGGNNQVFGWFSLQRMEHERIYDIRKHEDMNWIYPTSIFIGNQLHILGQIMDKKSKNRRKSIHSIFYPEKLSISKMIIDGADSEFLIRNNDKKSKKKTQQETDEVKEAKDVKEDETAKLIPNFWCCKVIYVEHLGEMLMFNGHNGNVFIWSWSHKLRQWKIFCDKKGKPLKLPKQNDNNFDVTLLHDRIIIICYNKWKEIWCYNLKESSIDNMYKDNNKDSNKWLRKRVGNFVNGITDNCTMINTDNEAIHFMSFINPSHSMIWIYYLLNKRILKRIYAPLLVCGYIRWATRKSKYYKNAKKKLNKDLKRIIAEECLIVFL